MIRILDERDRTLSAVRLQLRKWQLESENDEEHLLLDDAIAALRPVVEYLKRRRDEAMGR